MSKNTHYNQSLPPAIASNDRALQVANGKTPVTRTVTDVLTTAQMLLERDTLRLTAKSDDWEAGYRKALHDLAFFSTSTY